MALLLHLFTLLLLLLLPTCVIAVGDDDLIASLPNTTFKVNFRQFSGYLNAGDSGNWQYFYWLVESQQSTPENDPLIVWFNGGPGCSSIGGAFMELGPFHINRDKDSVYENVYAWNKYANVLFIESPIGVGFSFNTQNYTNFTTGDDLTAQQNYDALTDFFIRVQPAYRNRQWFIAGESYAGVYIPTLAKLVLQGIDTFTFPNPNFQGFAIGNGYFNIKSLVNSLVLWHVYHATVGVREWRDVKKTCCGTSEPDDCNFFIHLGMNNTDQWGNDKCGNFVWNILNKEANQIDAYNYYQDCYLSMPDYLSTAKMTFKNHLRQIFNVTTEADLLNYVSTDNADSYICWSGMATDFYMNIAEVQQAFHVNPDWIKSGIRWQACNGPLNSAYNITYSDTTQLFSDILDLTYKLRDKLPKNFRILVYNGDVDTICNWLGDAWHMDNVATSSVFIPLNRTEWTFMQGVAGYEQRYQKSVSLSNDNNQTIDVLTVKGSGHFVPNDRPGPALQMITNFIRGTDYSDEHNFNPTPTPNDLPPPSQGSGGGVRVFLLSLVLSVVVMVLI